MPICPYCQTTLETAFARCPNDDGYYAIPERDYQSFRGDRFIGKRVAGRFVIYSVIGHGAIGRVYKARQEGIGRDVVLKIFKLESLVDESMGFKPGETIIQAREDARARFTREAQVLGRLEHPNCVTVYDFGVSEDGSFLYIAMEYVAGGSMRSAVQRGIKATALLDIMRQILLALRHAHSIGVVHRDLKPENILLTFRSESREPVVKVLDFGIAKLVGSDGVNKTGAGLLFGTPAYMSPEQCKGMSDEVGPPSDIYAIGCLFFELVSGELPYQAVQPHKLLMKHVDEPVPDVKVRPKLDVPMGLAAFIKKCMAKAPEDRYAGAGEALAIFEGLVAQWEPKVVSELVEEKSGEVEALRLEDQSSDFDPVGAPAPGAAPLRARAHAAPMRARAPQMQLPPDAHTMMAEELPSAPARARSKTPLKLYAMVGAAVVALMTATVVLFYFMYDSL